MKSIVFALAFVSGAVAFGCTSSAGPSLSCETTPCGNGSAKTYQTCADLGGVTYNFGGQSCAASSGNSTAVEACAADAEAYCAGGSGTGNGDSGTGTSTGSTPCTFTVSGAQTGSGSCAITAAYDSQKGGLGFTITDSDTFTFGATLSGQMTLTAGTYTLADAVPGAGAEYLASPTLVYDMCTTSQNCITPSGGSGGTPQGSFTLTVTSPGPVTAGVLWSSPAGTLVLTLPAEPTSGSTGTVTVNVTL